MVPVEYFNNYKPRYQVFIPFDVSKCVTTRDQEIHRDVIKNILEKEFLKIAKARNKGKNVLGNKVKFHSKSPTIVK